jgi:hypothetical protein
LANKIQNNYKRFYLFIINNKLTIFLKTIMEENILYIQKMNLLFIINTIYKIKFFILSNLNFAKIIVITENNIFYY